MRFLLPLGLVLLVTATLFVGQMYQHQHEMGIAALNRLQSAVKDLYQDGIEYQDSMLGAVMEAISRNEALRDGLAARDRDKLLASSAALFTELRSKFGITHFYFTGPDRINILRVHQPQRYGDLIDRFTMLGAEHSGTTSYGVELGPLGTFTLRLVQPWYRGEGAERQLIGYVELGVEIDHILRTMQDTLGIKVYLVVAKRYLKRSSWESGMRMLGRTANWDQFNDVVLNAQAGNSLPMPLEKNLRQSVGDSQPEMLPIFEGKKNFRALFIPLKDAGERQVGYIIAMTDVSKATRALHHAIMIGSTFVLLAGGLLMILFFMWIRRIEFELADNRKQLQMLATHDGLTGLCNHRMFHLSLSQELQRARRFKHTLSMLMIDIDNFKQVNDNFGHIAGDSVLKELAQRIQRETRMVDSVYRYGGEEITLLLPETSPNDAKDIAERIRNVIERRPFTLGKNRTLQVTVSVGVASFPDHTNSPDELLSAADQALYQAKEGGRNQVRIS